MCILRAYTFLVFSLQSMGVVSVLQTHHISSKRLPELESHGPSTVEERRMTTTVLETLEPIGTMEQSLGLLHRIMFYMYRRGFAVSRH
jgi:hypothetical protein